MIRAKLCFVSEGISTDRDTGQVSAYGFVENFDAPSYPVTMQKIAFFCLWERTLADSAHSRAEFSITLDGKDLVRQPIDIDFGTFLRNRCTIRLDGFAPERPGVFAFRLAIPGHDTGEWVITASATPSAAADLGTQAPASPRHIWNSATISTSTGTVNINRR
jgi:hypothetical protein